VFRDTLPALHRWREPPLARLSALYFGHFYALFTGLN
jgi:hypothetical protein